MFYMDKNKAMLLVIDIQDRLSNSMQKDEFKIFLEKTKILINGANVLNLPIMQSLQYVKGLGNSVEGLFCDDIKKIDFEKRVFSCCYDGSELLDFLNKNKHIRQIIICGMETHVCVLQSARDLKKLGFDVVVACDAVISRDKNNKHNALDLMGRLDVNVVNIESILFDLLKDSRAEEFKAISSLVK
ncbi:isochorismatase family protein [Helicobacter sp. MIT 99-5507]|uniref:isochorismatase family protein n=1 Tax=Helicobacter sp. MIT 99-5507 TaxID=152489 RepID=UPI000E1F6066|nr:isochorismatase family protein [Helicobacter sp. MIT 99-5507]RDU58409.1 hydrolase [Helicobacter sp. MIT 99-5507]